MMRGLFVLLAWAVVSGCPPAAAAAEAPRIRSVDCWFEIPPGREAECGWLRTGDAAMGESVRLPVVRLPGRSDTAQSPVVYVPGGPGYPAGLDQAGIERWWRWQSGARWGNDLILFDPRGTGRAQPAIECPEIRTADRRALDKPLSAQAESRRLRERARACYRRLGGREALADFTPRHLVADLTGLIAALPEASVNLWGVSYGSRLALRTAARTPDAVRALVLDSAYPPSVNGFKAQPRQLARSLEIIADACAARRACAHPDIADAVDGLLARAAREPLRLEVMSTLDEPARTLALNGHRLLWLLLLNTYRPGYETRIAQQVMRAAAGDAGALRPAARRFVRTLLDPEFSHALYYTARCAGDGAVGRKAWQRALARYPSVAPYLGEMPAGAVCRFWRTGAADDERPWRPGRVQGPALLLQGRADPVTPPAWSARLAQRLPRAGRIVFKGAGHAVTFGNHCAMAVARAFLETPSEWRPPACLPGQRAE